MEEGEICKNDSGALLLVGGVKKLQDGRWGEKGRMITNEHQ